MNRGTAIDVANVYAAPTSKFSRSTKVNTLPSSYTYVINSLKSYPSLSPPESSISSEVPQLDDLYYSKAFSDEIA